MIDQNIKRCLGQMMHGVQVVGARDGDLARAYCSHWVTQVSFDEPIVMASVSPRHDTFALIESARRFSVSVLAGDQVAIGQYFSYPGRKFRHIATEYLTEWGEHRLPVVPEAVAWLEVTVEDHKDLVDHRLWFGRVTAVQPGRLRVPPLTYSSRLGWRVASEKAREPGRSVRDELLERLVLLERPGVAGHRVDVDEAEEDEAEDD